ncbi:MAG: FIST C-terminal domain-containing protein [Pseudodesulfovibrio sp.]
MTATTAYSTHADSMDAVSELASTLGSPSGGVLIFFASPVYEPKALASAMHTTFPNTQSFGCTTAGELVSGHMLKHSVVAMWLGPDEIKDIAIKVIPDIAESALDLEPVFEEFENHFQQETFEMDRNTFFGVVLMDGLRKCEERLMDKIGDTTNIHFVGGSAGDDLKFEQTHVFANGEAHTNAALLVLLEATHGIEFIKSQSFTVVGKKLRATKVDEANRVVFEFNNKPAIEAYTEALGVPQSDGEKFFRSNPVGLMIGNEPYVRSPMVIDGDSIVFYCNVLQGMELELLESGDIVADTARDLDEQLPENTAAIVNFHCILRTLELESAGKTKEYGHLFNHVPTVGFSTYGEAYIGHINQTSTILVIKGP